MSQPRLAERALRAPAAPDDRSMLLLELSVWEPIGRVRLASASVNSGAGVTSLSRNAHGDARWLANWHPDCVLASRGPWAVLSGRAKWFFRVEVVTVQAAWPSRRAIRDDLGKVTMTSTLKPCSVSGRSSSSACRPRTNAISAPGRPAARRTPPARAAPSGPLQSGPGGGGARGVVGETAVARGRLGEACALYLAGTREVHGGYTTGTAPS